MTTAPVELPTKRNSYQFPTTTQDIHSPSWIPLLNGATTSTTTVDREPFVEKEVSPYNSSSFSPISTPAVRTPRRPSLLQSRANSSFAAETSTGELEAPVPKLPPAPPVPESKPHQQGLELPATRPQSRYYERHQPVPSPDDTQDTTDTDGTSDSVRVASVGTSSLLGDQVYTLPQRTSSREDMLSKPLSASSSISSTRQFQTIAPPTSKYSRKPLPSTSKVHSAAPSVAQTPRQTPQPSPKLAPVPDADPYPTPATESRAAEYTETYPMPPEPEQVPTQKPSGSLAASKSSASQRRKRALHSHPSNVSLKSRPNSSSDDSDAVVPALPTSRPSSSHHPRKSTDSRTGQRLTLFESQNPSPAPTSPLPELPTHARASKKNSISLPGPSPLSSQVPTPALPILSQDSLLSSVNYFVTPLGSPNPNPALKTTSPNLTAAAAISSPPTTQYRTSPMPSLPAPVAKSAHVARLSSASAPPPPSRDHEALSSFMTRSSTLIFRRFDEVHVQLLLHLQDEIAQLEKELVELDTTTSVAKAERDLRRIKILRELRGLVAEYGKHSSFFNSLHLLYSSQPVPLPRLTFIANPPTDALFSSWSQMQASKAPSSTMTSLRQWLERPATSAGGTVLGAGAREDLKWFDGAREKGDLSAVRLGAGEANGKAKASEAGKEEDYAAAKKRPKTSESAASASATVPAGLSALVGSVLGSCAGRRKGGR